MYSLYAFELFRFDLVQSETRKAKIYRHRLFDKNNNK